MSMIVDYNRSFLNRKIIYTETAICSFFVKSHLNSKITKSIN